MIHIHCVYFLLSPQAPRLRRVVSTTSNVRHLFIPSFILPTIVDAGDRCHSCWDGLRKTISRTHRGSSSSPMGRHVSPLGLSLLKRGAEWIRLESLGHREVSDIPTCVEEGCRVRKCRGPWITWISDISMLSSSII